MGIDNNSCAAAGNTFVDNSCNDGALPLPLL